MVIDPSRWGERDRERPALVEDLQTAVVRLRKVQLTYGNRAGEQTTRLVEPWGLVNKDDIWYVIAGTPTGQRTFRFDRVIQAEVTNQEAERPPDFELADAWQTVVDEVEQRRSGVWATVLIEPKFLHVLRSQFGRQCEVDDAPVGGRVRVRVTAPTPLMIAQPLAGWGALIDVVDSPAVQAELARLGTELTACYSPERN